MAVVRRRRLVRSVLVALVLVVVASLAWRSTAVRAAAGDRHAPTTLGQRIAQVALAQVGYRTSPPHSYCNRFSAAWQSGTSAGCAPGLLSEEWCADFAAWVWRRAGATVVYAYQPGDLNGSAASFYEWGVAHGTWHAVGSGYVPQPGDVAVYGLDTASMLAGHVAVVTGYRPGQRGPDVVNGDGDHTGYSVVEVGLDQFRADTGAGGGGDPLSGYTSPTPAR